MPTFGDETERGFYLRDGGYYFAISDLMDLKLTGEIFTKGSWGASAISNYRKRYKYSGNLNFDYASIRSGDKGDPDFVKQIIGDDEQITCRPADLIEPELDKIRAEVAPWLEQEEDVLSYALFNQVAVNFFNWRMARDKGVDKTLVNKDKVYPV